MSLDEAKVTINIQKAENILPTINEEPRTVDNSAEGSAIHELTTQMSAEDSLKFVRDEIQHLAPPVESGDIPHSDTVAHKVNSRPSFLSHVNNLLLRVKYPGEKDSGCSFKNISLPAVIGLMPIASIFTADIFQKVLYANSLVHNTSQLLSTASNTASALVIPFGGIFWTGIIKSYIEFANERKNKLLFGKILTVNKTRTIRTSTVGKTFPGISEPFYGELHFAGKGDNPLYIQSQNPIQILRQGIRDLLQLAKACQENAPELDGIQTFVGPASDIVTDSLQKFGFEIKKTDVYSTWVERMYNRILDSAKKRDVKENRTLSKREIMSCLITRDELIRHIPVLTKFAHE